VAVAAAWTACADTGALAAWGLLPAVAIWTVPARTVQTSAAAPKARVAVRRGRNVSMDLMPGSSWAWDFGR
jgi:hypothetical protein